MRRIPVPVHLTGGEWIQVVRVHYRPGDSYDLHDHDFAEAFWIEQGEAEQTVNGVDQRLEPGTLVLMRPRDAHSYRAPRGFVMVNVTFRAELLDGLRARYADEVDPWPWGDGPLPTALRLGGPEVERLQEAAEALADDRSRLAAEGFLIDLLRLAKGARRPAGLPPWLERALDQLREDEHLAAGPAEFVRLCGRTPAHVNRAVRAAFGTTATELVNRLRLEHAARRLRLGDAAIADIAVECGFASLAHFYRAFGARFGATPRDFRHSHQASGQAVPESWRPARAVPVVQPEAQPLRLGRAGRPVRADS